MPGKGLEDAHQECVVEGARGTFPSAENFPFAPSNTPTPLKTRASEAGQCRAARHRQSRTHRSEGLQATRLRSGTKEEARENEQHRYSEAGLQKDSSRDKIIGPCTRSPLPQAARSVMPCPCRPVVRGCRRSCERERERTEEGAGRHSLHLSESAVSIPQDGNRNGSTLPCGRPPPFSPDFVPRTQKGPLAGALVSFSLIRPEPDTVIGTTRRFQPWRELPSWLRAGGSVR